MAWNEECQVAKSRVKTILIILFDAAGIIHHEFVP